MRRNLVKKDQPVTMIGKQGAIMPDKGLIKHVTDATFEKEIEKGVVLVDFHANWCGPCRMLAPVLEEVAKEVKGKGSIVKVDIDTEQRIASQFQIASVPTMILFKNGKEVNRLIGLRNAEAVKEFILSAV
jgi:thioredoxin 1